MEGMKKDIYQYYAKEIINSRTVLPKHVCEGLEDFFVSYTTIEDLHSEVFPPLEKAILRAPEVVLSGVLSSLISALPAQLDISADVNSRFCKPLLSNIKSVNANVRNGAVETLKLLITRCTDEKALTKVVDEILNPVKTNKVTNAEQRSLQVTASSYAAPSEQVSTKVLTDLSAVLAREASEIALEAEVKAFTRHARYLLENKLELPKECLTAAAKGCGEKRPNFRRVWLLNLAQLIWDLSDEQLAASESVSEFVGTIITKLEESFKEASANAIPSAQNGLITLAYVFTALSCDRLKSSVNYKGSEVITDRTVGRQALTWLPKPSFLLNTKVYTKLSTRDDFVWKLRALSAVSQVDEFAAQPAEVKNAWAQAFIYMCTTSHAPPRMGEVGFKALSDSHMKNPEMIGYTIIAGLWHWLHSLSRDDRDSAAVASGAGKTKLSL
ncbi:translational activator of GCN4, partial [Ascosphaera atra]